MLSYLTFAVAGASTLVNSGHNVAQNIAAGWDERWADVITPASGLYAALAHVGVIFAVGSLILWGFKIVQDYVAHGSSAFLHELIWPVIVIVFLGANGQNLSQVTLGIRGLINETNQQVLSYTSATVSLQEAYEKAAGNATLRSQVGLLLKQCQALTGTKQIECLEDALQSAQSLVDAAGLNSSWWDNLRDQVTEAQSNAGSEVGLFFAPFNALIGAANQTWIRFLMLGLQAAFQNTLEVSLLMTALLGPMALGASLLPVGAKPIFAWVTAMASVGIAKLSFNIVVGLAATIIANAEAGDHLWFLVYVGLMAPLLSMSLAAGGGMAVWQAVTNGAKGAVQGAASVSQVFL